MRHRCCLWNHRDCQRGRKRSGGGREERECERGREKRWEVSEEGQREVKMDEERGEDG
jgi:hypothetical protein